MEVGARNQQEKSAAGERGERSARGRACACVRRRRVIAAVLEQQRSNPLRRRGMQRVQARIISAQKCGGTGIAHVEGYTRGMSEELLRRITFDPAVMGGKACIRGMRMPVVTVLRHVASGRTVEQICTDFPYLEPDDIQAALVFAVCVVQERGGPVELAE